MHIQVTKFYDKFYFKENIIFLCFMSTKIQKKNKSFFTYFKSWKFLGVTPVNHETNLLTLVTL